MVKLKRLGVGFLPCLGAMQDRGLGHLFVDPESRVECSRSALVQLGHFFTPVGTQVFGGHLGDIVAEQERLTTREFQPGLTIAER